MVNSIRLSQIEQPVQCSQVDNGSGLDFELGVGSWLDFRTRITGGHRRGDSAALSNNTSPRQELWESWTSSTKEIYPVCIGPG